MSLRLKVDHWGTCTMEGQTKEFMKYEKDIFSGKVECPFKVKFSRDGEIVAENPIPLKANGDPKIKLFG